MTLAGLINALKVVGKKMGEVKIAFIGSGASNVACSRLIFGWGADPAKCLMVDSKGILGKHRKDLEMRKAEYKDKWKLCNITNAEGREGDIPEAIKGADVVIALSKSGPGRAPAGMDQDDGQGRHRVRLRQPGPGDLAVGGERGGRGGGRDGPLGLPEPGQQLAGLPGHLPRHAGRAGTHHHRRDVLCRGRKRWRITWARSWMPEHILPDMDDWEVFPREAAAVAMKAVEQDLAANPHHL